VVWFSLDFSECALSATGSYSLTSSNYYSSGSSDSSEAEDGESTGVRGLTCFFGVVLVLFEILTLLFRIVIVFLYVDFGFGLVED